ncbi:CAP domain-containing protein [Streptomyces sp. NPDC059582]|uniref:CAP domain-containing protein n=1 Tax=Streptomyces sp. NPDC059582 TaxID=3346875 RepID=UPI00367BAE40
MGRHRRSAAGRAATGVTETQGSYTGSHGVRGSQDSYGDGPSTMGIAPYLNPEAYAETTARSDAYLFAADEDRPRTDDTAIFPADGFPSAGFVSGGHLPGSHGSGGYGSGPYGADDFASDGFGSDRLSSAGFGSDRLSSAGFGSDRLSSAGFASDRPASDRRDRLASDGPAADRRPSSGLASDRLSPSGLTSDRLSPSDFISGGFGSDAFSPDAGARRSAHRRRKKRTVTPVRSGLLGVSAAVALGTVAVASGVVPGLENYKLGGGSGSSDNVQAADSPSNVATEQGGASGTAAGREDGSATSRDAGRATSPAAAPSASASTPAPTETESKAPTATPSAPKTTPSTEPTATKEPRQSSAPVTVSATAQAEAEVLKLVNEERAKVGCSAVTANGALTDLAEAFSEDMAQRNFFDHTDPDGATPWDRAAKAGISDLGGENIARGQADAAAVMNAWMNSPGHRANILNCDFQTLGVGVHLGEGGPWWTQDFGY